MSIRDSIGIPRTMPFKPKSHGTQQAKTFKLSNYNSYNVTHLLRGFFQ
jgi:hypothetical protein